ncbi:MAG: type IV pilin N-terminal domain-containing protein [Thermoplasmata archaeon]|nr:type IV pilin N-terminal domain-containing protein [Thermoplasmata archaeon]
MTLRGKRGVSDVLGTILILALTVTLFSSIFFFVNTFPKPATQPASQFTGQLNYTTIGTKTYVNYVTVTHLGGPLLFNFNTQIYVVSQAHPQNTTTVYSLASGGLPGGAQATWGTGQIWTLSLAGPHLATPDNVTVTVVSANTVVYRQILPGSNPTIPPIFVQEGTTPGAPMVSSAFSIFVQISDPFLSTSSKKVYLNITTPGLSCNGMNATGTKLPMTYNATNGLWFIGGCTAGLSGTYYVTAWATDANPVLPLQNSIIFPVTIGSSGGGGGGGGSLVLVTILTNTSVPVVNQPLTVVVSVTNNGASSGTAAVTFGPSGGGTYSPTSASGTVGAGSTVGFQTTFTPTATGGLVLSSSASIPGIGSSSATLALTVFPKILLVSENVPAGTVPTKSNESALLASELLAAGFPFTTVFVPCASVTSYPANVVSQFTPTSVVIIDFGSNSSQNTCKGPDYNVSNSVAAQITSASANGTAFWVVGNRAFLAQASGCETGTYRNYLAIFGIRNSNSNCYVVSNSITLASGASTTYTASSSLLAAGISSPFSLNGNITGVASYATFKTFRTTGGGTSFMTAGGGGNPNLGVYLAGNSPAGLAVATGADPAQFGDAPAGPSWGAVGTQVAYNVVNYLAKLATNSAPTRSGADFAIAGAWLTGGQTHTTYNSFLVNVRSNDASNGILTAMLLVNGVPAIYQGTFVTATAVEAGNGVNSWLTLTWQAPAAGTYVFSFVLSTQPADGFTQNNQYNYYLTNLGFVFT